MRALEAAEGSSAGVEEMPIPARWERERRGEWEEGHE